MCLGNFVQEPADVTENYNLIHQMNNDITLLTLILIDCLRVNLFCLLHLNVTGLVNNLSDVKHVTDMIKIKYINTKIILASAKYWDTHFTLEIEC